MLEQAKGEFLAIQDHDDVWTPEKLEHQVDFLQKHEEFVACGTGYLEYYSSNQTGYFITLPEKTNFAWHTSLVFRKTSQRYETSNPYLCDLNFMKQILSEGGDKIANLPEIAVLHYNKKHLNNYSFQWAKFSWQNLKRALKLRLLSRFLIDLLPANFHSKVDRLIFSVRYGGMKTEKEIKSDSA
ncbi:glycosyltransferase [bacterium]|nr:glycosyltransferase [bacterium]